MAKCPNGYWECPECGDFVENTLHICPNCRYDINKKKKMTQKRIETISSYTPSSTTHQTSYIPVETNGLFSNIGGKLKTLAKVTCWVGIAGSVIGGIVLMTTGYSSDMIAGIITLVGGSLFSWIGSLTTYAFGDLVENTAENRRLLAKADAERNNDRRIPCFLRLPPRRGRLTYFPC